MCQAQTPDTDNVYYAGYACPTIRKIFTPNNPCRVFSVTGVFRAGCSHPAPRPYLKRLLKGYSVPIVILNIALRKPVTPNNPCRVFSVPSVVTRQDVVFKNLPVIIKSFVSLHSRFPWLEFDSILGNGIKTRMCCHA